MGAGLRVAVFGLGGFAGAHHDAVRRLEADGELRLVATCDPAPDAFRERCAALEFRRRKVRVFRDWRELLAQCGGQLDLVTIPTPVPLHAPMHRACVEGGIPVYLEKPPTLALAELDAMIATDRAARRATQVGFNFIIDPLRWALKRRLLAGEFGRFERVSVLGLWPRGTAYYGRAAWPGRLAMDGRLVLDSPMGNAMAHYVHNALFWAGPRLEAWAEVRAVAAELYRAHAIEGVDTAFVRAELADGVELRLAMSHACAHGDVLEERIACSAAEILYRPDPAAPGGWEARITWRDGRESMLRQPALPWLDENLRLYAAYLRGEAARPLTRLEDSRPFVLLNGLAYVAAPRIRAVGGRHVARVPGRGGGNEFVEIGGLAAAARAFAEGGLFPAAARVPWAVPGGRAEVADIGRLETCVRQQAWGRGRTTSG